MRNHSGSVVIAVHIIICAAVIISMISALAGGHLFVAMQCFLTILLCALPNILNRKFGIEFPSALELAAILFIFASTFLGEILGFYNQFPLWDTILHTMSGFLMAAIGFSLTEMMNRSEYTRFSLSPGFVAFFAFCFSMTTGVVWEFYEFGMDMLFAMDMQKDTFVGTITSVLIEKEHLQVESAILNGEILPRWLDIGLIDTMKDLFANAAGAIIFSLFGMIYMKKFESGWIIHFIPRSKK